MGQKWRQIPYKMDCQYRLILDLDLIVQFFIWLMQAKIDLLTAYSNKLALDLSIKQFAINNQAIEQEGRLRYASDLQYCRSHQNLWQLLAEPQRGREKGSLAKIAFELVQIGLRLSSLNEEKNKLILNSAASHTNHTVSSKMAESQALAWQYWIHMDCRLRNNRRILKRQVIKNYQAHPVEVRKLMSKLNIGWQEWKGWIRQNEKCLKRLKLKEVIKEKAGDGMLSLTDCKKMAKKVYDNKMFKVTDRWCCNFIVKNKLEGVVDISGII